MSHITNAPTRDDLVHRYAARKHAQHAHSISHVRSGRTRAGIQSFGRVPITRRRARAGRSRQAVTTLMATAIMATATPAISSAESSSYEVQDGDTLTQIAAAHDLTVDELISMNSIQNPDQVHAGDELTLSGPDQTRDKAEVEIGDTVYQIKKGDTLFGIASEYDVSLSDLVALNQIEQEDTIYVDDFLVIPTGTTADVKSGAVSQEQPVDSETGDDVDTNHDHIVSLHLVARGETPSVVAQRYGITVEQLMAANDMEVGDMIINGSMLRIPDASWEPYAQPAEVDAIEDQSETQTNGSSLENMPWHQQSLAQSSEAAAASIATSFWGHQVSEWVFIENMPSHQNPHRGYRGDMNASPGGTSDYGVYPKPLSAMLANYGFVGDEFYTMGDPEALRDRIDQGQPVLVWMTEGATQQSRHFEWYQGERFTLVPHQQVVVAYGYDDDRIYVSDPATGEYVTYSWEAFINSWSLFDGMSMAVYPKG